MDLFFLNIKIKLTFQESKKGIKGVFNFEDPGHF